jgi:hypothetical protein
VRDEKAHAYHDNRDMRSGRVPVHIRPRRKGADKPGGFDGVEPAILASAHSGAGLDVASRPTGCDGRPFDSVSALGLRGFQKLENKEAVELIPYSERIYVDGWFQQIPSPVAV